MRMGCADPMSLKPVLNSHQFKGENQLKFCIPDAKTSPMPKLTSVVIYVFRKDQEEMAQF